MQHFLVDTTDFGTLNSNFPTSPYSEPESVRLYLEDKLSSGYDLVSFHYDGSNLRFIFKVVAK